MNVKTKSRVEGLVCTSYLVVEALSLCLVEKALSFNLVEETFIARIW